MTNGAAPITQRLRPNVAVLALLLAGGSLLAAGSMWRPPSVLANHPLTLTVTALDVTKTYGAPMPELEWEMVLDGTVHPPDDDVHVCHDDDPTCPGSLPTTQSHEFSWSGLPTCSTEASASSPVGSYPITCTGVTVVDGTLEYVPGALTISPAPLVVTAADATRAYGTPDPSIGHTINGLVAGDDSSSLDALPTCSSEATRLSNVGIYATSCSGTLSANYEPTFVDGHLSVTRAPVTVKVEDAERTYGSQPGEVALSFEGLPDGGDGPIAPGTLACTIVAADTVPGSYLVNCSALATPNYQLGFAAGTLTVVPALLTIAAQDVARARGEPNPPFEVTYEGFVLGHDLSILSGDLQCASVADAASPPGVYPITCSGLAAEGYAIVYADGVLSVAAPGSDGAAPPSDETEGSGTGPGESGPGASAPGASAPGAVLPDTAMRSGGG
ncbi:MAG: MBG domain-containing protein [Candidatus Limnocylindria bacterium]